MDLAVPRLRTLTTALMAAPRAPQPGVSSEKPDPLADVRRVLLVEDDPRDTARVRAVLGRELADPQIELASGVRDGIFVRLGFHGRL